MGRLVAPRDETGGAVGGGLPPGAMGFLAKMPAESRGESPDDFKTRVAKYVPAEVVGFYIAANSLLTSSEAQNQSWLLLGHIGIFALGLIGTPVYLIKMAEGDQPIGLHLTISTFAFILWAYAIPGGIFTYLKMEDGLLAALLLVVFSFVAGWFQPTKSA